MFYLSAMEQFQQLAWFLDLRRTLHLAKAVGRMVERHACFLCGFLVQDGIAHIDRRFQVIALCHQEDVFPLLLSRPANAFPILEIAVHMVCV